jgi:hypothetical protein
MIDVSKLDAGPELDALVAEKVMGWTKEPSANPFPGPKSLPWNWVAPHSTWGPGTPGKCYPTSVPKYSTDIAAAWEVVEKLRDQFEGVVVDGIKLPGAPAWQCIVMNESEKGEAQTAPLAICRAALKAVGA